MVTSDERLPEFKVQTAVHGLSLTRELIRVHPKDAHANVRATLADLRAVLDALPPEKRESVVPEFWRGAVAGERMQRERAESAESRVAELERRDAEWIASSDILKKAILDLQESQYALRNERDSARASLAAAERMRDALDKHAGRLNAACLRYEDLLRGLLVPIQHGGRREWQEIDGRWRTLTVRVDWCDRVVAALSVDALPPQPEQPATPEPQPDPAIDREISRRVNESTGPTRRMVPADEPHGATLAAALEDGATALRLAADEVAGPISYALRRVADNLDERAAKVRGGVEGGESG